MPDPISSRSAYDPSSATEPNVCDPTSSSCAPLGTASDSPRTVTIPPVHVNGELAPGARGLVARHDQGAAPTCKTELGNAEVSCLLAASSAGATVAAGPTGIGLVMGLFTTAGLAAQCSRDVLAVMDCREANEQRANIDTDCSSRGGTLLSGANGELVCLVTR
jgi:hypothetical protein